MREKKSIRTTTMAESITVNRNRDLCFEVRHTKGRHKLPSSVGGAAGDEDI